MAPMPAMKYWSEPSPSQPSHSSASHHGKHRDNTAPMPSGGKDNASDSRLFVIAMALVFLLAIITVLYIYQWATGRFDDDDDEEEEEEAGAGQQQAEEEEEDETLTLLLEARARCHWRAYAGYGEDYGGVSDSDSDSESDSGAVAGSPSYVTFPRYGTITQPSAGGGDDATHRPVPQIFGCGGLRHWWLRRGHDPREHCASSALPCECSLWSLGRDEGWE